MDALFANLRQLVSCALQDFSSKPIYFAILHVFLVSSPTTKVLPACLAPLIAINVLQVGHASPVTQRQTIGYLIQTTQGAFLRMDISKTW